MIKKIATSIDILINVGRFEHIQVTKHGEADIEFENDDQRIKLEDQLTTETIEDGSRSLQIIVDVLGGKMEMPMKSIADKISKRIPTWLEDKNVPNLADTKFKKAVLEKGDRMEKDKSSSDNSVEASSDDELFGSPSAPAPTPTPSQATTDSFSDSNNDDEDLFA